MKELFITYRWKKVSLYDKNWARGMHFYIKVYRMTQQKLAEEMMTQQCSCCPNHCKIWLFLHLHEISCAYTDSRCNIVKFSENFLCLTSVIYIFVIIWGMRKVWITRETSTRYMLYFSFSIHEVWVKFTRIPPKL